MPAPVLPTTIVSMVVMPQAGMLIVSAPMAQQETNNIALVTIGTNATKQRTAMAAPPTWDTASTVAMFRAQQPIVSAPTVKQAISTSAPEPIAIDVTTALVVMVPPAPFLVQRVMPVKETVPVSPHVAIFQPHEPTTTTVPIGVITTTAILVPMALSNETIVVPTAVIHPAQVLTVSAPVVVVPVSISVVLRITVPTTPTINTALYVRKVQTLPVGGPQLRVVPTVVTMVAEPQQVAIQLPNSHSHNQRIPGDTIPSPTNLYRQPRLLRFECMWRDREATSPILVPTTREQEVGYMSPLAIIAIMGGETTTSAKRII